MLVTLFIAIGTCCAGVHAIEVFHGAGQEACSTAGGVADDIGGLRVQQLDHRVDDMPGRAKLTVDASGSKFAL